MQRLPNRQTLLHWLSTVPLDILVNFEAMENSSSTTPVESGIINEDLLPPESLSDQTQPELEESDRNTILNTSIDSSDQDEIGHIIIHENPDSPEESTEEDSDEVDLNENNSDVSSDEAEVVDDDEYDVRQYMNLRNDIARDFE